MRRATVRRIDARTGTPDRLRRLTRRIHFYLGLYLLLFIWLFSVSGLLLNHPEWEATHGFWERRRETVSERAVTAPAADGEVEAAKELMAQLGIVGELQEIERTPADRRLEFQVVRPGQVFRVEARLAEGAATVRTIDLNAWGVLDALHKFTGVSMTDPDRRRDWVLTKVWSVAMDAVALGLIVLVLSGIYLWYRLRRGRLLGAAALGLGASACGFFLFGLMRLL